MGKALVVEGLAVNNPLCVVTIKNAPINAETELKNYYSANSSVNATEKVALNSMVQNIIDAGLWNKVKYFAPMLGDNISDLCQEIRQNQILPSEFYGYEGRKLIATTNTTNTTALAISNQQSIFMAAQLDSGIQNVSGFMLSTVNDKFNISAGGYICPNMTINHITHGASAVRCGTESNRIVVHTITGQEMRIRCNDIVVLPNSTETSESIESTKTDYTYISLPFACSQQTESAKVYCNMLLVCEPLEKTQEDFVYGEIDTFLKAVGKR